MTGSQAERDFHSFNRQRLSQMMDANSVAFIHSNDEMHRNGDQNFQFRQNSDLIYLTGIQQEKTVLCLFPDHPQPSRREVLFIRENDPYLEIWNGHKLTNDEASAISGVQTVMTLEQLPGFTREVMQMGSQVFLNSNEYPKYSNDSPDRQTRMNKELIDRFPTHSYARLAPLLSVLRLEKEPFEIEMMSRAADITGETFRKVLRLVRPGISEFRIEAEIEYEFRKQGSHSSAYAPIVAAGSNALCLHYIQNRDICKDGDLVLLDFGCEWNGYASDLSRTIPVSGRFSPRQKEVYEAVLDVYHRARSLFVPGMSINKVNHEVGAWMEEAMIDLGLFTRDKLGTQDPDLPMRHKYLPHGVSHFIGLDVHDVGTKDEPFRNGMVLTCEPGLYIREEGIGIRIETDLLISPSGAIDLFEGLPVTVEEIEKAMQNSKL